MRKGSSRLLVLGQRVLADPGPPCICPVTLESCSPSLGLVSMLAQDVWNHTWLPSLPCSGPHPQRVLEPHRVGPARSWGFLPFLLPLFLSLFGDFYQRQTA